MSIKRKCLATVFFVFTCVNSVFADEVYYYVPVKELTITEGNLPSRTPDRNMVPRHWRQTMQRMEYIYPYAVGKQGEEMYVGQELPLSRQTFEHERLGPWGFNEDNLRLAVCAGHKDEVSGWLYLPNADFSGLVRVGFTLGQAPSDQEQKRAFFLQAKQQYYEKLGAMDLAGAAWFRHRAMLARQGQDVNETRQKEQEMMLEQMRTMRNQSQIDDSYSLFSGGRALSENLQLERELVISKTGDQTIDVNSLEGITIREINWKQIVSGLKPKKDPLAKYVPADQHVIFFPTFEAMTRLIDESKKKGTPVLRLMEPHSEDARTNERYERQLCLSMSELSRIIGRAVVSSVAFTGSDPYLRTGSDVAVLFETKTIPVLREFVKARYAETTKAVEGTKVIDGNVAGIAYTGVVSPGREICSYMAAIDNILVVTNSISQLERIAGAGKTQTPSIDSLDEYVFFRDRYKLGAPEETALVIMTDATIRRWCGPQWRIGCSRRTRAAAVMMELQCKYLDEMVTAKKRKDSKIKESIPGAGEIRLLQNGLESNVYGTLDFLTPIAELEITKVTPEERDAYNRFRQRYQMGWRRFFDPIAIRLTVAQDKVAADVTVRPLTAGSDYREFIEIAGNKTLPDGAGDLHKESLLHFVMSIDPNSPRVQRFGNFIRPMETMTPDAGVNVFNWLGDWVSVYVDDDPLWQELDKAIADGNEIWEFMGNNVWRLPLAVHVDVGNSFKVVAFMVSIRAFIEQSAPEMTIWETLKHNESPYVKVSLSTQGRDGAPGGLRDAAIYYALTPKALILTMNETLLKRAMDRMGQDANSVKSLKPDEKYKWLGDSAGVKAKQTAFTILQGVFGDNINRVFERRSWSNLAILNEWKRMYPKENPVDVHLRLWKTKLVCPGGGQYVWNEEYQTMESTIFGHPGKPKEVRKLPESLFEYSDADFGLTFEGDGLRARTVLQRTK
ncbi:MAG: hypothetical protein ABII09_09125 [Planctomycetota bacterium]